ncbi:MAG: hypothetical protein HY689_14695 [Chloroflexi bacterium]|nr:hypothetical protein [Chloroflexota bacterium]
MTMRPRALVLVLGMVALLALVLHEGTPRAQASLPPPILFAPVSGSVLGAMGATLTWDLPPGATQYQLQVLPANNDGPAINLIRNAENQFTIPAPPTWYIMLPDMTYTWRVRVTDKPTFAPESDLSWGPWSDQWSFHTPLATSAGMEPVAPADGAVLEGTTPVILRWTHPSPTVFYYEVQVSGDTRFDPNPTTATSFVWWNLVHGGVTGPSNSWRTPPLEPGTTYYWRMRPRVQGDGMPVPWSPIYTFSTPGAPKPSPTPTPSPTPSTGGSGDAPGTSGPGGTSGTGGSGGTPTVTAHRVFPADLAGYVHVVGEVMNPTGANVYAPQVTVTFFMPDGAPAGQASTYTVLGLLHPQDRTGFRMLLDPRPGWSRYEVSVTSGAAALLDYRHPSVQDTGATVDANGVLHVKGEVTNDTGGTLNGTKVVVTLYDGQGRVLNVESRYSTPDDLNAGAIGAFDVTFTGEYQGYAKVFVAAEGWRR